MARRWTELEVSWLRQVWPETEIPAKAIAHALKRTEPSIQRKAHYLKVGRPWNGSPEHLKQLKRLCEAWVGSPEHIEHLVRLHETWIGSSKQKEDLKQARKKAQETWVGSSENLEQLRRMRKTWIGSPEQKEVLKQARKKSWIAPRSPKQIEQQNLARKKIGVNPTWPEARFYGLVYGYNGLAEEFRAQQYIPTDSSGRIVDGLWRNVIFELDGSGHHAFGDRTQRDRLTDAEHKEMGYQVVREGTSSELFLRLLQVVESDALGS